VSTILKPKDLNDDMNHILKLIITGSTLN